MLADSAAEYVARGVATTLLAELAVVLIVVEIQEWRASRPRAEEGGFDAPAAEPVAGGERAGSGDDRKARPASSSADGRAEREPA